MVNLIVESRSVIRNEAMIKKFVNIYLHKHKFRYSPTIVINILPHREFMRFVQSESTGTPPSMDTVLGFSSTLCPVIHLIYISAAIWFDYLFLRILFHELSHARQWDRFFWLHKNDTIESYSSHRKKYCFRFQNTRDYEAECDQSSKSLLVELFHIADDNLRLCEAINSFFLVSDKQLRMKLVMDLYRSHPVKIIRENVTKLYIQYLNLSPEKRDLFLPVMRRVCKSIEAIP